MKTGFDEMKRESAEQVNAYLDTLARMEPDIATVDTTAAAASIAISLKRIADALEEANRLANERDMAEW